MRRLVDRDGLVELLGPPPVQPDRPVSQGECRTCEVALVLPDRKVPRRATREAAKDEAPEQVVDASAGTSANACDKTERQPLLVDRRRQHPEARLHAKLPHADVHERVAQAEDLRLELEPERA